MSAPEARRTRKSGSPSARTDAAIDRPGLAARQAATRLLGAIIDTRTSLDGLTDNEHGHPQFLALDGRDRALVRAILMTALRYRRTITAMIAHRLDRPLPPNAHSLTHILHVGAAQLLFLDVPDSAAVDLAVSQAQADPRAARFSGLVNAILRSMARGGPRALEAALHQTREAPDWFIARLESDYGREETNAILAMHRLEAPIDFTVKSDPEKWAEAFGGHVLPTGSVRVTHVDGPVTSLPGFAEGEWWVQDAAAALPARMMGDIKGKRVADLCAAPGGKTAQLALAGARVTALDLSANRLKRLNENLARLGLQADTLVSDLRKAEPAEPFDAVLLDAPCSSTGTVRRHPDVPWTKTAEEIEKLAALQFDLLGHAVRLTKPGGTIIFSNCSLDKAEGETMVTRFLASRNDVESRPLGSGEVPGTDGFLTPEGWLRTTPSGWPTKPAQAGGLDGFFAARLVRTS